MTARTPDALAEAYNKHLSERTSKGPISLSCESEDEAALVAHRLRKLGWKAETSEAMVLTDNKFDGVHVVRVTGRRKK